MAQAAVTLERVSSATVLPFPQSQPLSLKFEIGKYLIRLANHKDEIEAALKLRYAVFNVELGWGFSKSFASGKDQDSFDDQYKHVILIDRDLGQVVGTFRLQTYQPTSAHLGYSSSIRFNLNTLPNKLLEQALEFGRVCIARGHRNRSSLTLIWRYLLECAQQNNKPYLLASCLLESQDPLEAGRVYDWLAQSGHLHREIRVAAQPGAKCLFYKTAQRVECRRLSSAFTSYLKMGAKVCSMPAIDREFRTIEFLSILDLNSADYRIANQHLRRIP